MKENLLGIDVGGTKCAIIYGIKENDELHIIDKKKFDTTTVDETIDRILCETEKMMNLHQLTPTNTKAIGICCGGPLNSETGIVMSPDIAQCAFRIGDSSTNAITPFLFYMPLVLTYMRQYDKQITYGSLLKYTWRYSLGILVVWTLLFIVWYLLKIPMGL